MKILLADKFQRSGTHALKRLGHDVENLPELNADDLPAAITQHDPDILLVRSTKVHATVFDQAQRLSLVVRAGVGYDNIDVAAASRNAISVANCPGKNAVAVAELTIGLIIAADRLIPHQTADLRNRTWAKKHYGKAAAGLKGRTLGILGLGHIGLAVIRRAQALDMNIVAWSRSLNDDTADALGIRRTTYPIDTARAADVLSVHLSQTPQTEHLVNADIVGALRRGSILVNTARGKVVDEAAVLRAMNDNDLRYAADVFDNQPAPNDNDTPDSINQLAQHHNFVGTHHCGASTEQAQEATADEAVRIIRTYDQTGNIPNIVNRETRSLATRLLRVRHLNKAGVLAHVIGAISEADINIEEMENVIFSAGEGACAKIQLDAEPSHKTLDNIRAGQHVLSADLTTIT